VTAPPQRPSLLEACWPWFLRFTGVAIGVWQSVFQGFERPSVLIFAAGLITAPEVYHWERKRRD
jgi:hypothetical protein